MLSQEQIDSLLDILKKRFEKNMHRHKDLDWSKIHTKLESDPKSLNLKIVRWAWLKRWA